MASFNNAVRWAFSGVIAAWSLAVMASYFAGPERGALVPLMVLVNLAMLIPSAATCLSARVPATLSFRIPHVVFVLDWALTASADTPFALATYQIYIFAAVAESLNLRRRIDTGIAAVSWLLLPTGVYLANPSYGLRVVVSVAITYPILITAGRLGLLPLLRFAEAIDAGHEESLRAMARWESETTLAREGAEQQRKVHDTAINTLAAIVQGGSAVADPEEVRRRCLADAQVIDRLLDASGSFVDEDTLDDVLGRGSLEVRRTGLSGEEFAELRERVPERVRWALLGAVSELLTNARKHSGADHVVLDVRAEGRGLRVKVLDRGRGFEPGAVTERGLATSVRERLGEQGIDLRLESAPGAGVCAEMSWEPTPTVDRSGPVDVEADVDRIRMIGALLMTAGAATGGIAEGVLNHPGQWTPDFLLCGLALSATIVSWLSWRRQGRLTAPVAWGLVAVGPAAFLLSGWAVDFGKGYNPAWQILASVFPLLILVAGDRSGRRSLAGGVAYSVTGIAAAVTLTADAAAAATTAVAVSAALVWLVAWALFNRQLLRIAERAVRQLEDAVRADEAAAAQAGAALVRARWRIAGIESAASLLRELATTLDPMSDEARKRAGREELYLRELILLPSELVNIGTWFCQALGNARDRDVELHVRSGSRDVDLPAARRMGAYLVESVAIAKSGARVVASLFDAGAGPHLRVVSDDARVADLARRRDWGPDLVVEVERHAEQVLVHVRPRGGVHRGASASSALTGARRSVVPH